MAGRLNTAEHVGACVLHTDSKSPRHKANFILISWKLCKKKEVNWCSFVLTKISWPPWQAWKNRVKIQCPPLRFLTLKKACCMDGWTENIWQAGQLHTTNCKHSSSIRYSFGQHKNANASISLILFLIKFHLRQKNITETYSNREIQEREHTKKSLNMLENTQNNVPLLRLAQSQCALSTSCGTSCTTCTWTSPHLPAATEAGAVSSTKGGQGHSQGDDEGGWPQHLTSPRLLWDTTNIGQPSTFSFHTIRRTEWDTTNIGQPSTFSFHTIRRTEWDITNIGQPSTFSFHTNIGQPSTFSFHTIRRTEWDTTNIGQPSTFSFHTIRRTTVSSLGYMNRTVKHYCRFWQA